MQRVKDEELKSPDKGLYRLFLHEKGKAIEGRVETVNNNVAYNFWCDEKTGEIIMTDKEFPAEVVGFLEDEGYLFNK